MSADSLRERLPALDLAVRSLTRDEIMRFVDVVRESATAHHKWPLEQRFWFDGTAGLTLSREENDVVRELWTRMNSALVYAVSGEEIDGLIDRPGLFAGLDRIGPRWQQIEGQAATVLERTLGGDVWLGTIGIWNALCADLLRDRREATLRDDLATSWSKVRPSRPVSSFAS